MGLRTPIIENDNRVDLTRYTSGLKKDKKYGEIVDSVLTTLSAALGIPFYELRTALFFSKGSKAKGILVLKSGD